MIKPLAVEIKLIAENLAIIADLFDRDPGGIEFYANILARYGDKLRTISESE